MRNKGQWLVAASLGIVIVGAAGAWQMLRGDRRPERPSVTVPELSALARELPPLHVAARRATARPAAGRPSGRHWYTRYTGKRCTPTLPSSSQCVAG
jgi:hypothetical protein